MPAKTYAKLAACRVLGAMSGRHAVLLPRQASGASELLDVETRYRAEGPVLTLHLKHAAPGRLRVSMLTYRGHFPVIEHWAADPAGYAGPCALTLDMRTGEVRLDGRRLGAAEWPLRGRRFCFRLRWQGGVDSAERLTGHYVPWHGRDVGQGYFQGDDYVDHEAQSAAEHPRVLEILSRHGASGPVLEAGCATGGLLAALGAAGYDARGIDFSAWACERARERVGADRVFHLDAAAGEYPASLRAAGPFATFVLWAVLEHFPDPFAVLARLGEIAAPGARLVINTTNAGGLSRFLFGADWEGHYDWTHHSVDLVSADLLREKLPALGWRIRELTTHSVWDSNPDPLHASLRDWASNDQRARRLLRDTGRGDLMLCVAERA